MLTQPALQALTIVQNFVARFRDEDRGATAVEYGLLVAAIAAIVITLAITLGAHVGNAFTYVNTKWVDH